MSKKQTKDSHFIPSPTSAVTEYENAFIEAWNKNTAEAVAEVLKFLAKATATAIKEGVKIEGDDIEKAHNVGDIHSNGVWVWTEYRPGKFDWRQIKQKTKTASEVWNINPDIQKLNSSKECVDFLIKADVISNKSDLTNCDLESAKAICSTLFNLKNEYKFETITVRSRPISNATMQAVDGQLIEINSNFFKKFDTKRYYDTITKRYQKQLSDAIDFTEKKIKSVVNDAKLLDILNETKNKLEARQKKFSRWTMGGEDTLVQDIIIHEMGHILNAQCTGGCGHRFSPISRTSEYLSEAAKLNIKRNDTFVRYKNEATCISEYSTTKPAEFFAEAFVAYVHKSKELPKYVVEFFDEYFSKTTPKI